MKRFVPVFLVLVCLLSTLLAPAAHAAGGAEVSLTVQQSFHSDGLSVPPRDGFTYELTAQTAAAPMPPGSDSDGYSFTIAGTGDVEIGPINLNTAGTYTYTLRCVTGDLPGYTIDRQIYTIELHVPEGIKPVSLVYTNGLAKVSELQFEHIYGTLASDPVIMVDPPVQKTVNGTPPAASTFTFRLEAENLANPMPAGSVNGVKDLVIIGAGQAEFGTWRYIREGTYRYRVSELNAGIDGYTYDKEVYTITDVVTAAAGRLLVTRSITNNAGQEVSSLSFVNTYTPPNSPNPSGGGPKTGDFSNPMLWTSLIAGSSVLLMALILLGRKTDPSEKRGRGRGN